MRIFIITWLCLVSFFSATDAVEPQVDRVDGISEPPVHLSGGMSSVPNGPNYNQPNVVKLTLHSENPDERPFEIMINLSEVTKSDGTIDTNRLDKLLGYLCYVQSPRLDSGHSYRNDKANDDENSFMKQSEAIGEAKTDIQIPEEILNQMDKLGIQSEIEPNQFKAIHIDKMMEIGLDKWMASVSQQLLDILEYQMGHQGISIGDYLRLEGDRKLSAEELINFRLQMIKEYLRDENRE